ncbi:MAG: hypothetical protein WCH62_07265, partial [Candidatus Omnitrophota bacterium]
NALGPLYLKMVEQGQKVSLDALETRLKTEGEWRVRQAIVNALGPLYLKMVEQGQKVSEKDQRIHKLIHRYNLDLVSSNEYVLDKIFSLSSEDLDEMEKNLNELIELFKQNNTEESLNDSLETYVQLTLLVEFIFPEKGLKYIEGLLTKNGGIKTVIRFLDGKKSFLLNGQAWIELKGLLQRIKEDHSKKSRKVFTIDMNAFFKILNIASAFIDLGVLDKLGDALKALDPSKSLLEISRELEESFLRQLAEYFNLTSNSVSPNVQRSLYMPYLSRIREALKYIEQNKPDKLDRFKALIKAMLEDRFWDFISNEEQSDEQGVLIARHNKALRDALAQVGINADRWLGKDGQDRMPEARFMYYETTTQGYDPVADTQSVIDYIQRILNDSVADKQKMSIERYLTSIGVGVERDDSVRIMGLKSINAGKKKDIIAVVSEGNNIEGLLRIQQDLLKESNIRETARLLEMVTHWGERIQTLKTRLSDTNYQQDLGKQRERFRVRPILRSPGHDLFIGDFTNCCIGMSSGQYPDAMMDRLIDEGLNVIEVIDESTEKTIGAAWVYIAEDGSFVIQNLEINADYERSKPLMDRVGEEMVNYAREFARHIGAKRLLIGNPGHGKYFGSGSFVDDRYGNRKVSYGLDKIGGYLGEKYYLDSTGKPQAYLVADFAMGVDIKKNAKSDLGGIDLTPANMNLQTQNSSGEIKFYLDPAMLQQLQNAPGFVPIIINVQPLNNLQQFLGADATNLTPV